MSNRSINAYNKKGNTLSIWVWFEGNGATAVQVYEGQGVVYDALYATTALPITVANPQRYNRVLLPTSTLAAHFAGVLAADYIIPAGGSLVQVYIPGSVCNIRVVASGTINSTVYECCYTGGNWKAASHTGKGVAKCLQSVTYSATPLKCLAVLDEGLQSGLQAD